MNEINLEGDYYNLKEKHDLMVQKLNHYEKLSNENSTLKDLLKSVINDLIWIRELSNPDDIEFMDSTQFSLIQTTASESLCKIKNVLGVL